APDSHALYFDQSKAIETSEQPWPDMLSLDGPAVMVLTETELWLSPNPREVYRQEIDGIDASVWRALELSTVVSYDVKQLYHDLASHGVFVQFGAVHDIRQAAFLIDPLRRDRS